MPEFNKPDLLASVRAMPFSDQVKHWGSYRPWGKRGGDKGHIYVRHKGIEFSPDDVTLDEYGNIIAIPEYDKPCLGTVAVLRHGREKQIRRDQFGQEFETTKHRCGKCLVRDTCRKIVLVRMNARPKAKQKFLTWRAEAIKVLGSEARFKEIFGRNHTIYTGGSPGPQLGYLWREFLIEFAAGGPFANSNDAHLDRKREEKREHERKRRRKNKQAERERNKAARRMPDMQFLLNLDNERDRRQTALMVAREQCDAPPPIGQLDARGCMITAAVWREKTLLEEMGERPTAGKIAKRMLATGKPEGITEASLRQRIHKTDLKRIEFLESKASGPIWPSFDPLKSAEDDEYYDLAA